MLSAPKAVSPSRLRSAGVAVINCAEGPRGERDRKLITDEVRIRSA